MMWPISDRYKAAIPASHTVTTTVTMTTKAGTTAVLPLIAGTVTTDRSQRIRRTATLTVQGDSSRYAQLCTPGTTITVQHGISYGGTDTELVPMIRGEVTAATVNIGDNGIQISVADRWQTITAAEYLTPYIPDVTARRTTVITAAVTGLYPTITVRNTATDNGLITTSQAWTSRSDMITALANDGGMDVYFAPDGALVITDEPTINDPAVWTIKTGPGGTLKTATRNRPLDRIYNTVILTPATGDTTQTWDYVIAQITDTSNPRHPSNLGRVAPYRYAAPTVLTANDAQNVAQKLLTKLQGSTETLALGVVSNPALEAGDIVRVLTPTDGGNTIVTHLLDSAQTDLASGAMTCNTRASIEVTA